MWILRFMILPFGLAVGVEDEDQVFGKLVAGEVNAPAIPRVGAGLHPIKDGESGFHVFAGEGSTHLQVVEEGFHDLPFG